MSLPPIFYHYFKRPLPYAQTLALQEKIHQIQLLKRKTASHKDILLLLQHRPVYTAGRRQTEEEIHGDRVRLRKMGAEFVTTSRGGELTYHGPGQLVGYPLLDLSRWNPTMGARNYVCRIQKTIELHLKEAHGIDHVPSDHTGVFLSPTTKIGSIGVQVRHRLTSHGFAFNLTQEPLAWFDQVVACGLHNIKAVSVESARGVNVNVDDEIPGFISRFARLLQRDIVPLESGEGEVEEALLALEKEAENAGNWSRAPAL
ncbi:hypothetical protein AX16_002579 [Volvariella volvacea WC 439]|nr:hypothetical protein AX16_002579 [Volvariella volvacea WC 439]